MSIQKTITPIDNSVYLERHTVDCNNKPITQFKLHRNSAGDKIFYKYHCAKGPNSNICRDVTTNYNDQGGGNVIYLDRHDVKCNEGEYLSKFRMDVDDNDTTGKYRYEYKCCKPPRFISRVFYMFKSILYTN